MNVKRFYVPLHIRDHRGIYQDISQLGWKIGLIGIRKSEYGWELVHIPSRILMSTVDTFINAKALARMFMIAGVSEETTLPEITNDPLFPGMMKVYRLWHFGHA